MKWKFNSDGSVNGWGWRLTVYPIMPAAGPQNMQSDRSVLSRPSMDLVVWLLDSSISSASTTLADREAIQSTFWNLGSFFGDIFGAIF